VVIAVPAAMLLVLLVVQACLWAQAASLVSSAANQGQEAAGVDGGTLTSGVATARAVMASGAGREVQHVTVVASLLAGDTVEVTVSGDAEPILPWLHLHVSAVRAGPKQEFRDTE